jgi:SAM-dependent methyltransferase
MSAVLRREFVPTRKELLLKEVPKHARIIEIGPCFNPVASKAEGWNCFSIDHLSRDGLVAKYLNDPTVDTTQIEAVDYIWTGGALSAAVPSELHGSFDVFIASHVIEHTPDLVAFLDSAAALLKPEGAIILAVPDRRYCFDYFQPLTTAGQIIEAHGDRSTRHSRRMAFDHVAYYVSNDGGGAWGQQPLGELQLNYTLEQARATFAEFERSEDYLDVHAWRFTPASFQLLLLELARLGETDWRIERITEPTGCEFYAWLRRGGKAEAAAMPEAVLARRRLALLKRTLLETKDQIDWLLAGSAKGRVSRWLRAAQIWRHATHLKAWFVAQTTTKP